MIPPTPPGAEANPSSSTSDANTEFTPQPEEGVAYRAAETSSTPLLTDRQDVHEDMQQRIQEHLRALELQLHLEQQRQRDRMDEELDKMRQQLMTTTQEQHQQHQAVSAAFRETVEEMRKEVSDALHRLSQDLDQAMRQSEKQARRALDDLRDELFRALFDRDQVMVKRQMLGQLLITLGRQLQETEESRDT